MEDQKKVWDKIAISWNKFRKESPREVKEFINTCRGNILDIGCGNGRNLIKKSGLRWFGLDISEKMIELAKENAKRKGVKATFYAGDIFKPKFKENFFDCALCYSVLHCIPGEKNRNNLLKEMFRIMKPGGISFVSVWEKSSKFLRNKEKEAFVLWGAGLDSPEKRYTYIYSFSELKSALENAGFFVKRSWENDNINFILKKPLTVK